MFVPVSCGIIYIVKIGGDYFFLYIWLFIMLVTIFIYTIYPDFIAPLFDKYIQLPPGELRSEIEVMAKSLNFPLSDLYVVVGSKRSAHSNAYFFGFLKKKRIVLFDTLLKDFDANADEKKEMKVEEEKKEIDKDKDKDKKGCDNYEILAVVGHEMGHWKLNHTIKNLIIGEVILFIFLLLQFDDLKINAEHYKISVKFIAGIDDLRQIVQMSHAIPSIRIPKFYASSHWVFDSLTLCFHILFCADQICNGQNQSTFRVSS